MSAATCPLPAHIKVLERGWLSSNSVLLLGDAEAAPILIDTGYVTHAEQTKALVAEAIAADGRGLSRILNTHLHSDHCGGNAALAKVYGSPIHIPPGDFDAAQAWDMARLSFQATGQQCPRFTPAAMLPPGSVLRHGGLEWQMHAAPGHDPHSLLLFEPESRILISADALWEHGFGIVFPEIDGLGAFDEVAATLDLIDQLAPRTVIPGHGPVFTDARAALAEARSKLAFFRAQPMQHARHAAKALIMFHMLEVRALRRADLLDWLVQTPIHQLIWQRFFSQLDIVEWSMKLIAELTHRNILAIDNSESISVV